MDTGAVYVTLSGRVSLLKTQVSIPLVTWTHTHQFPRHTENWMGIQVGGIPEKKLAVPGIHNVWGNTNNCRKDEPKMSASTLENRGSQIWKRSHLVSILRTIQNPLLIPLNSLWICWLALLQVHFGERWNTKLTLRNAVAGNKGSSRILQRRNVVLESVSFLGTNWREPIPEGCTNPAQTLSQWHHWRRGQAWDEDLGKQYCGCWSWENTGIKDDFKFLGLAVNFCMGFPPDYRGKQIICRTYIIFG